MNSSASGARSTWSIRQGLLVSLLGLSACGGGGGNTGGATGTTPPASWTAGVFQPSAHFAAQCQNPRSGNDPVTGDAYPDVQGTTLDENNWLRSWSNELYLWYSEIPDVDPGTYATTAAYFDVLKTPALTASGSPKDRFHFTYTTTDWENLSQSGADVGYGIDFDLVSAAPPRVVYAAFVWSGYAAAAANISRGAKVLAIDGVDMVNGSDVDTLNAGLYPSAAGESHQFTLLDPGAVITRTVTLVASDETENPVPLVSTIPSGSGPVGYLLFNDHIATAEAALIGAITQLKSAAVTDLVLDIRYNGGGYLDVASELAYMIAGPGPTAGATFQKQTFNSKNPSTNPVTGSALAPTPFHSTAQGFSTPSGTALPYLGLPRVFVLTGSGTCSASEAIINGLIGVNVQVIQVGATTCGKPYGFYPQDNCGTTYFSIEFSGENAKGFGDYSDGFSPQVSGPPLTDAALPGCSVADDYTQQLGDPAEARLAAALTYRNDQSCPAATGIAAPVPVHAKGAIHRPFWRENQITRRR